MKRVVSIAIALGAVTSPGAPAAAQPAQPQAGSAAEPGANSRSPLELVPVGHAFKDLAIDNPLGDVRVEGYDGSAIRIETRKHAPDDDTLDRLRVRASVSPDGTVRIMTTADRPAESRPVPRSAVRIDLVIHAPRDARVDASASTGKLEVFNMDAGGDLDTASGAISVHNMQGELFTHSVSGATTLAEVFGSVDAATVSSDMDLDSISGEKLVASANRGRIVGRRVRSRNVELTTTDGMIRLEAEAALHGHLMVASVRGDVDVKVHRHGGLTVRARGAKVDLGGQVQTPPDGGDGWVQKSFGHCEPQQPIVELRTQFGNVQLTLFD